MRKIILLITTISLSFGIWLFPNCTNFSAGSTSIQDRLAAVKKYKYYLDKGNDKISKEMDKVDLVIGSLSKCSNACLYKKHKAAIKRLVCCSKLGLSNIS